MLCAWEGADTQARRAGGTSVPQICAQLSSGGVQSTLVLLRKKETGCMKKKKKNMDMEIKCCLTQLVIELCQWTFGLKIHYLSWMNIFRALNSVVGRHNQTIDGTRKKKNVSIVISCWALFNLERNQTRF